MPPSEALPVGTALHTIMRVFRPPLELARVSACTVTSGPARCAAPTGQPILDGRFPLDGRPSLYVSLEDKVINIVNLPLFFHRYLAEIIV
jgi:hypothetical protein